MKIINSPNLNHHILKLTIATIIVLAIGLSCLSNFTLQPDSDTAQKYPWLVEPIQRDTQIYFCEQLNLGPDNAVCSPNHSVRAIQLVQVLQARFLSKETRYSEIAKDLSGYPVEAEESTLPDGTVTSRAYVYLLTEFDGFCVYFYIRDLQTEVVDRISSSSVGSGPSPTVCGSNRLRAQPRPFLKTATPTSVP